MNSLLKKCIQIVSVATLIGSIATVSAFAADVKLAKVTGNNLRFRSEPSIQSTEMGRLTAGTDVVVTDVVKNGEWFEVVHNYKIGYLNSQYVTLKADADIALGDGLSTGNKVNVRQAPSTNASSITKTSRGKRVAVIGVLNGWYKVSINGKVGFMHPDYLDLVKPVKTKVSTVAAAVVEPVDEANDQLEGDGEEGSELEDIADAVATPVVALDESVAVDSPIRAQIVTLAQSFLGTPYRYGAMNPKKGFDCSGFTTYLYKQFGYSLNRSAAGQTKNGTAIGKEALNPGDLVLFRDPKINRAAASHAGLYIGNGKFIHASSRGGGVKISSLNDSYYARYFIGGRNIL